MGSQIFEFGNWGIMGGMTIVAVEAGTVIEDEETGETGTVTDTTAVRKGLSVYVTKPAYEALKAGAHPQTGSERNG